MKKRFTYPVAALAAVCLIAAAVAFVPGPHTAAAAESRYIDLYLIAGQSNAAGYSSVSGVTRQTFSNVMYAGEVNRPVGASGDSNSYLADFADSVTTGLGRSGNYIGPEYGMAEVLDPLYTGDHKALIFKSAAGGTSLQNTNSGESATYGNWLPPSERNNYPENAATGVQYDVFMENFTAVYNKLVAQGYTPRVRGMAWMQGEADRSAPGTYKSLIQTFIADIRADLSDVTGADLSQMPFVMGEISDTFGSYGNVNTNRAFNDMLHEAASLVPGTAVTESGRYVINDANGIVGTDQYHWSGPDMEEIGMLFAEEILALASDIVRVNLDDTVSGTAVFSNGAVTYAFDDGTLTLTPAAAAGFYLASLTVNGTPAEETDGQYTAAAAGGVVELAAVFSPLPVYRLSYELDESMGTVVAGHRPTSCAYGLTFTIRVWHKPGYEVAGVTCNGADMTLSAEINEYTAEYTSPAVTGDSTVVITFRAAENTDPVTPPDETPPDDTPTDGTQNPGDGEGASGGCGGALAGTLALAAAALAVFVRKP